MELKSNNMCNTKKPEFWVPDSETYNQLQKLKKFVDFVAEQEETYKEHKANTEKVKYFIENLCKPETFTDDWNTCIDIYDPIIQGGHYGHNYEENKGLYWKRWWIWFELGVLQINIVEEYADKDGYQDEKWIFDSRINFIKEFDGERIWGDTNYAVFVEDAMNFRNYITNDLEDVETEIDIFEKFKQHHEVKDEDPVKYSVKINLGNKDMIEPWER
jgi:uncharacterized protein YfbU (UPF0304 family)